MRDTFLKILTLLPLAVASATLTADTTTQPNIVFIFSDDHALNAISAYGGPLKDVAPTPNIDRLANEGAIFTQSFVANSICGPSRACILTGKHSHVNGFRQNGDRFDGGQDTFPKRLQDAGYQTAVIGKWHLGTEPVGFDHWEVLPGQGYYYKPKFRTPGGIVVREGYVTDLITDMSIEWLENRDQSKPFMLMSQHKAPHRNWVAAQRHLTLFDDVEMPVPYTLFDDYSGRSEVLKTNEMTLDRHFHWKHDLKFHGRTPFPEQFYDDWPNDEYPRMTAQEKANWDAAYEPKNQKLIAAMKEGEMSDEDILLWKYHRYIRDYLRVIRAVDENVGRLLDYLDEAGLSENTIVIYSSDQGFYLGEHGWYDKRWMFEQSLSMPFLVRWPAVIEAGTRNEALIQNIDYAPTFLEVAGAEVPDAIQGESLLPLFQGEQPKDWRESIYYAYYENPGVHNVPQHDGVRTDRYKLFYMPQYDEWQMFDLEKDPEEMTSVYDHPEYAPIRKQLTEEYQRIREHYDCLDYSEYVKEPRAKGLKPHQ
ncbi:MULTISPECIES: sulfatase [unclassified Lentimonas]|uniref:sulfatase family protein n=1 Tax=unclassified Lentimonas TaxID=2630993 RepID=UPI00132AB57D|nr:MULTISPECIES: sulfatase [unclassified Lentimonas]CAA6679328.1 Choline-sulfatase (EC [Lentimonas sp. CC4]CAA6686365.1 Choline-sulfatase (EC [Lentimonas sp. CC6]CAA7076139.1 Choline-sulfatase (EC [Lentimonas sp. CC4]CAA7170868.1 Choline-sulfatase (EC [Lentimonas sp. CC21]CAA7181190.1 Choline-sulfatase (EC [Lentimonas sp. CC8]